MNSRLRYALLALVVIGIFIPYLAFIPFVVEHGVNVPLLIKQAGANRIATFAWLDVIVSAVTLLVAAYSRQFVLLKQAVVVTILTLTAGVSAGLPMLFYFMITKQENSKEKENTSTWN